MQGSDQKRFARAEFSNAVATEIVVKEVIVLKEEIEPSLRPKSTMYIAPKRFY